MKETKLYKTLYQYQKDVIDWGMNQEGHFLFHMDMGTGKTRTSLAYAEQRQFELENNFTLILCQGSKILDWEEDAKEWWPNKDIFVLNKNKSYYTNSKGRLDEMKNSKDKVVIVSYGKAWRWEKELDTIFTTGRKREMNSDTIIICDESQKMKSSTSKTGKFGYKLSKKVDKMVLLSGDAISNGYIDLYNQMKIMGVDLTLTEFYEYFVTTRPMPGNSYVKIITGYKNTEVLLDMLKTQAYFLKTEDVLELPKQNYIDIKLELENNTYNQVKKDSVYEDETFDNSGILFGGLRQLASGFLRGHKDISLHKQNALKDLLTSSKDNFVIFYNFKQELEDIKKIADELKIKVFEMNGTTKDTHLRKDYTERKLIVSQYMSGSTGQNWQDFNHTLYYSPTTVGTDYKQSLKRTHRVGQDKPVFYYFFKTKGTLEDKIYESLKIGEDYTLAMFEKDENK